MSGSPVGHLVAAGQVIGGLVNFGDIVNGNTLIVADAVLRALVESRRRFRRRGSGVDVCGGVGGVGAFFRLLFTHLQRELAAVQLVGAVERIAVRWVAAVRLGPLVAAVNAIC